MDIKSLNAYNASLLDYLGKGKTGNYFESVAQNLLSAYAGGQQAQNQAAAEKNVNITLSDEAKALLAKGGELESELTGVQKGSQDFMMSFFDESGIDLSQLSDEVLSILEGLQGVIGGVTASGRDVLTDAAESRYSNGAKKAYTLMGDGQRLRVGIEYAEGKPTKLSITDITGGVVETAEITLGKDDNDVMRMTIERTQREYKNGHMQSINPIEPLSMKLYAA